ncbi:DJ-1/PfpI family protein [Actinoalloteichus sp. GBA129-24]|uniref:DJ-1/PfpI family protein n=1 Tax=Actinoalloteichus sp. GBA129-24 TaxID=1612551 RepID=UPI000950788D|nr:DJ-1/PfpI family protein [Actinoalloteichus sp. GBA129-24]APU19533.1 putative intracellular protease/amidase [Actinoalloteichus sp. GBA129-24]
MDVQTPFVPGRLAGRRIGLLMESDYVENEIAYYRMRFAEEGAEVSLLTRLWGNSSLTFTGHEQRAPIEVDGDLEQLDYDALSSLSALIVPSGMVADRLRYTENVDQAAPAVEVMRRAFRLPNLIKGFSCHGLLLLSTAPDLVRGRSVTCHNNLVGDVRNMGAVYSGQDVVVDRDLVTSRTVDQCHLLARTIIEMLAGQQR